MGGDHAPEEVIQGVQEAIAVNSNLQVILTGRQEILEKYDLSSDKIEIVHADHVIGMNDSAVVRDSSSSIAVGMEIVRSGEADAFVSAGNTGACMAQAVIGLKRLPGIIRPAIPAPIPTTSGYFMLMDAGANVDNKPEHLQQFAVMGNIYSKMICGIEAPRVGLLNNGTERKKGNRLTQETYDLLQNSPLNFIGYVEANSIFNHQADVVICDGFVGNVVLKTCEGLASYILTTVATEAKKQNFGAENTGAFLHGIQRHLDYSEYGGAPLLGINGNCIVAHGSSKAKAIKNAIRVACQFKQKEINKVIQDEIKNIES
jgi:glycerol-3-phosphate acyltransferase PlsX